MATKHKIQKALTRLVQAITRFAQTLTSRNTYRFLRKAFVSYRRRVQAGFVLPTTVLLVLVVTLVIGTLLFRTFQRTEQVQIQRQQQVIYNAATPVLDRARAKLEYLFTGPEYRLGGIPGQDTLAQFLKGEEEVAEDEDEEVAEAKVDRFTLGDETRIDINGGGPDNAWFYTDEQGNRVAYSIILQAPNKPTDLFPLEDLTEAAITGRANNLQVRTGPMIAPAKLKEGCTNVAGTADSSAVEAGWFEAQNSTAFLYKNFQINVVVINNEGGRRNITTLELEQDREAERGNKWGAWFNSDMEIHPGDVFRWNGAMHSQANIIAANNFTAYLISSPNSCLYDETASDISVADNSNDPDYPFTGQFVAGLIATNAATGSSLFNLYDATNPDPTTQSLTAATDSVTSDLPDKVAINPRLLFTKAIHTRVATEQDKGSPDPVTTSADWAGSPLNNKRLKNKQEASPFLDDSYRADDRWGPKAPLPGFTVGTNIVGQPELTRTKADIGDDTRFQTLGLDGYWERRADVEGLRLIVGERLELGNPFGWEKPTLPDGAVNQDADPLFPAVSCWNGRCHESLQYKTLRDNLAAVQGMMVYKDETPLACMAMTAHPGTKITIDNSTDFSGNPINPGNPNINFFTGRGTNGWEFKLPDTTQTSVKTAFKTALNNLAYFAGDPLGAFPAKKGAEIHPYPQMTMWGNFSNLRRALNLAPTRPANDSLADRSYIDSATCTVGMLASNIKQLEDLDPGAAAISEDIGDLGTRLTELQEDDDLSLEADSPAEAYLTQLEIGSVRDQELAQLGWLLHLKEQVTYDRTNAVNYGCEYVNPNPLAPLCAIQSKFPALYYLFPTTEHGEPSADDDAIGNRSGYITGTGVNGTNNIYQPVDPSAIALTPETWGTTPTTTTWNTPTDDSTGINPITRPDGTPGTVAFLDKGMYDGRQAMGVRVLDIDLNLLKPNVFPQSGIVYAFREDAVREDGIARPGTGNGVMSANPSSLRDPAVEDNGISRKPVDYYADPDRRPHGFRLKNGADLSRTGTVRGLSFISDNPVYIQGNFNLHSTDGTTNNLEEFGDKLNQEKNKEWSNFYTRNRPFEDRFAKADKDSWRPSEILADAITMLSSDFCDGSIEDGLRYYPGSQGNPTGVPDLYGCKAAATYTSYMGMNRVKAATPAPTVRRENPFALEPTTTTPLESGHYPIKINRNGTPELFNSSGALLTDTDYLKFTEGDCARFDGRKCIGSPVDNQYNAILIQGIVPSRKNQPYGGLHNFPRTLELWQDGTGTGPPTKNRRTLSISGSFLQFNFSTYATGPFDQDAWETTVADSPEGTSINYYFPAKRNWGYDVGLQLAPVPPISERLTTMNSNRSEFYYEPAIDDPYIKNLRCAPSKTDGPVVDPSAECN